MVGEAAVASRLAAGRPGLRSRRSLVVLAMVVGLSTLLVFDTQRAAFAFHTNPKYVAGAQKLATPARFVGAFSPWGLALSGAVVLATTADVWVPFLRGLVGKGGDQKSATPASGCQNTREWVTSPSTDTAAEANGYTIRSSASCGTFYGQGYVTSAGLEYTLTCKTTAGAVSTAIQYPGVWFVRHDQTATLDTTLPGCAAGTVPVRILLAPHDPTKFTGARALSSAPGLEWGVPYTHEETDYSTTITCKRPDGTTFTATATASGADATGVSVPACGAQSVGARPISGTVSAGPAGSGALPVVGNFGVNVPTEYANCAGATVCEMEVYYQGKPCTIGHAACVDWSGKRLTSPEADYTCRWGEYVMPMGDCRLLERAYERPLPGTPILTEQDVDGITGGSTPAPVPPATTAPTSGSDPWAPSTVPTTAGTTTVTNADGSVTQTQTQLDPATGTKTVTTTTTWPNGSKVVTQTRYPDAASSTPSASPAVTFYPPPPAPERAPDEGVAGEDCLGAAVTLRNPASWVEGPVKCALRWAFVPSAESRTALGKAASVGDVVPFSYVGDMRGWVSTALGGGSGRCLDLGATVGPFGRIKMVDTCTPGPVEGILMGYRGLLTVVLYVVLFVPLLWWAWRTYAPASTSSA